MRFSSMALLALPLLISACDKNMPRPTAPVATPPTNGSAGPISMVRPLYPGICPGAQGIVNIKFIIETDGSVSHTEVLNEEPKDCGFASEAVRVFQYWRFAPWLQNGVPVPHEAFYRLGFKQ
jgi:periplasmic protein TonB